ncbi:MAG: hydrogenase maturation nickel metallochaperone HypA [Candidatus Omnitrophica bacterium]|nr:hydrogenase maturation nickel metallochaperone HypA [Candidatus Omnitrophota bacterium]
MDFANRIIVSLKEKIGERQNYKGITVSIVLGPFTHVTPESLRSAFALLNEAEGFKNVFLNIEKNKTAIKCKKCQAVTEIAAPLMSCPSCGADDFELLNTEEFSITSLQIDDSHK